MDLHILDDFFFVSETSLIRNPDCVLSSIPTFDDDPFFYLARQFYQFID